MAKQVFNLFLNSFFAKNHQNLMYEFNLKLFLPPYLIDGNRRVDRPRVGGGLVHSLTHRALKRGVVLDCIHESSTRGRCLTSGLVHSLTDSP